MGRQPPLDDLGAVDDDVVADDRDHWRGRVGGQQLLAEAGEAGADGLAGHLVQEAAGGKLDRAEDGAATVLARGHDLLSLPSQDPGGPHPSQQVEVGLVLGQHHRTVWEFGDGVVQVGEDLVAVGVASCDQAGPPPCCDLTDTPVQGPQAHGRPAEPLVKPTDGPGLPWAGGAAGGSAGRAWGCPAVAGRCGADRPARRCRGVGSGGSSGAPYRGHSPAGRRSARQSSRAGRAGPSPGGSRPGGGRATGAAGHRGRRLDRRGWRTRWGDAYWRRPRRVVWCVEAPTTGEATSSVVGSIPTQGYERNFWSAA
jgi:hypothetical protein